MYKEKDHSSTAVLAHQPIGYKLITDTQTQKIIDTRYKIDTKQILEKEVFTICFSYLGFFIYFQKKTIRGLQVMALVSHSKIIDNQFKKNISPHKIAKNLGLSPSTINRLWRAPCV